MIVKILKRKVVFGVFFKEFNFCSWDMCMCRELNTFINESVPFFPFHIYLLPVNHLGCEDERRIAYWFGFYVKTGQRSYKYDRSTWVLASDQELVGRLRWTVPRPISNVIFISIQFCWKQTFSYLYCQAFWGSEGWRTQTILKPSGNTGLTLPHLQHFTFVE